MPSRRVLVEIGAGVAVLAGFAWLQQHDAKIRLTAVNAQIEGDRKDAAAKTEEALKAVRQEQKEVKTPEQAVRIVNRYVTLPVPMRMETESATAPNELKEKAEEKIAGLVLPAQDAVPLANYVEDCRACAIERDAAKEDNKKLTTERDEARKALKGGTWLQRLKNNAKYLLIGGLAGAAAVCGSGHCR